MTEGLFILTTMFVAYVVYTIVGDEKAAAKPKAPEAKPELKPEVQAVAVEQPKPQAAVANAKPAAAKTAAPKATAKAKTASAKKAAPVKPAAAKADTPKAETKPAPVVKPAAKPAADTKAPDAAAAKSAGLKNPKTGEVVTTYTNYRFTKRWIKEALVAEGFLDKIYKNNELNPEAEAKIKEALAKLELLDNYRA